MEHRWGTRLESGRRAAVGAAMAVALVAPAGAAFADDSPPPVPTPVGTLVVGETPDGSGLAVGFVLDPGAGAAPPDAPGSPTVSDAVQPSAPTPPRPLAVDREVSALASCALTAVGCRDAGSLRLAWEVLPLVLGPTAGVLPADPGRQPSCASGDADAPGRRLTLTTCWPLWAGQLAALRLAVFAE